MDHVEERNLAKKQRLVNISSGTSVHLGKGLFYNSVEDGDDGLRKVNSKDSFETGMNMNSMNSSRDEFSSRNMNLDLSPERRKRKLASLQPLNAN